MRSGQTYGLGAQNTVWICQWKADLNQIVSITFIASDTYYSSAPAPVPPLADHTLG